MKITAHCIVKNEDRWVWFAIQSVLPYVDELLIFDTGSSDKTIKIIELIKSPKIIFEKRGEVNREEFTKLRQEQINRTKTEWFLILDGDEIWPKMELEKMIQLANNAESNISAVFNRTRNCIGDVYHYLPESSGNYEIAGHKGNLNIRLIRKKKTLKVEGIYPDEYFLDENGAIQKQSENLLFVDCWYLHATFLNRSSADNSKTSGSLGKKKTWEKGLKMKNQELPEVFQMSRPELIDDPFKKRSLNYELIAFLVAPIINIKRLLK